jgi:hypothetical protein
MIWVGHPGSESRILVLTFYPSKVPDPDPDFSPPRSRIPDPGVKKAPDPDPQHWFLDPRSFNADPDPGL